MNIGEQLRKGFERKWKAEMKHKWIGGIPIRSGANPSEKEYIEYLEVQVDRILLMIEKYKPYSCA